MTQQNNWSEYSKLVLNELENLSQEIRTMKGEIHNIRQDLAVMRAREDRVVQLLGWKNKMEEYATPSQIGNLIKDVDELKSFRTKATMVFATVQFAIGIAMAFILKLF
jgi:predicted  nucleic acid-binding Zn-ribbon protein